MSSSDNNILTGRKCQGEGAQRAKTNVKRLVQARLPFKVVASEYPTSALAATMILDHTKETVLVKQDIHGQDTCKRKLSCQPDLCISVDQEGDGTENESRDRITDVIPNKKKVTSADNEELELLDDNSDVAPQNECSPIAKHDGGMKLQIKLPLSTGKRNKRRKSMSNISVVTDPTIESSDDVKILSEELNPQKRKKLDDNQCLRNNKDIESGEAIDLNVKMKALLERVDSSNGNKLECISLTTDDETEEVVRSTNTSSDVSEEYTSKNKSESTDYFKIKNNTNINMEKSKSNRLTPKQLRLLEQRKKARIEKEFRLQEEKRQKQLEKKEKELLKKREREEKEEQRRKEREEKDEQRRREREERERRRLADIEAKNEEKRKRHEAKEEELRKKEEERKRKEQEKEEAEIKKKKAAEAFSKFFVAKVSGSEHEHNSMNNAVGGDVGISLAFRPFQIKGDMKLAPVCRKVLTEKRRHKLDLILCHNTNSDMNSVEKCLDSELYLDELRSGKIVPGKWRRQSSEFRDDVLGDELERVGLVIIEGGNGNNKERMRAKLYQFYENRRPPYYGTWRKKSNVITPRRPFARETKFFDYEVDSDDEWEEEEPGESLDGSDDDKEKESEDDEYEVDNEWFVPHGHLSDEELQNEDEFGSVDEKTREAQKIKLEILQREFAREMKKQTEKIQPRLIGCVWVDENGNQPEHFPKVIWDALEIRAMLYLTSPLVNDPEMDKIEPISPAEGGTEKFAEKLKPITLSDNLLKDLIRLVHGNNHSKNFLVNEFIAYVEKNEMSVKNGDMRRPLKSTVREKIEEFAEWQVVDVAAIHIGNKINQKKKKSKKKLCWVVSDNTLAKMELQSLDLNNTWDYTLPPKFVNNDRERKDVVLESSHEEASKPSNIRENNFRNVNKRKVPSNSHISKYAKLLTANEMSQHSHEAAAEPNKYVPPLSVGREHQSPSLAKNKLISQFLQKNMGTNSKASAIDNATTKPIRIVEQTDVIVLD